MKGQVIVITAPEPFTKHEGVVSVFLAGGITGCEFWQWKAIDLLKEQWYSEHDLIVFNPRRQIAKFTEWGSLGKTPEGLELDPSFAEEQVAWEFAALESASIFSMWFAAKQIQPICMYELGRHMAIRNDHSLAIGADPKYPRFLDLVLQNSQLKNPTTLSPTLEEHVNRIIRLAKDRYKLSYAPPVRVTGYHQKQIRKGELGELSKLQEELDELSDAKAQSNKILMLCELSDLYGAMALFLEKHLPQSTMEDLRVMSEATARSFKSGERK
jgi:hypothetical protein